jgi:hypothetical protein
MWNLSGALRELHKALTFSLITRVDSEGGDPVLGYVGYLPFSMSVTDLLCNRHTTAPRRSLAHAPSKSAKHSPTRGKVCRPREIPRRRHRQCFAMCDLRRRRMGRGGLGGRERVVVSRYQLVNAYGL